MLTEITHTEQTTRAPAARAVDLTKTYGTGDTVVTALTAVSVGFHRGCFTAVMGPSGSGKSTLMHCMAGLDAPTSGRAFIGDREIGTLADDELTQLRRDRVGFVFQAFNLVPTLTAAENITLPADLAGAAVDEAWLDQLAGQLGIADRLSHRPSELSGGQQQRIACARALITRPELIFADEPTGNLDSNASTEVLAFLTATVPIAVMFVLLQRQLARGGVAGLVVELGALRPDTDLRQALARTLGDPSLELAFWFPAERCYVDGDGAPVRLPEDDDARRATLVERDGQPIAALLHDPFLDDNTELVQSVCAAASLALENERLQAELRARLVDLQASRARLVGATDAERRRIERDLHDGTQQRLVSIAMSLGLLESKLPAQEGEARPLLRETREALVVALQELRELTHGINPPLLVERGLAAALDELCRRAALPTHLRLELDGRLPDELESAAYFVASEALTNAAKHSHASEVRVLAACAGGILTVEVADDGIGGAGTEGGSGLRGLADRVEALGGRFTVSSPPGRGTTLRAEIPCA